jgi:hypothetical protein
LPLWQVHPLVEFEGLVERHSISCGHLSVCCGFIIKNVPRKLKLSFSPCLHMLWWGL